MSTQTGHVAGELRRAAKRARAKAPRTVTYADPVMAGYWRGVRDVAVMLEKRATRFEKAECAAHKPPRRYTHVTRCKRCNTMIEKVI